MVSPPGRARHRDEVNPYRIDLRARARVIGMDADPVRFGNE
jgi:hypothetical protein